MAYTQTAGNRQPAQRHRIVKLGSDARLGVAAGLAFACQPKHKVVIHRGIDLNAMLDRLVDQPPKRVLCRPALRLWITTSDIGEFLMDTLKAIDKIAYVRFASVYRDFQDEQAFMKELERLVKPH